MHQCKHQYLPLIQNEFRIWEISSPAFDRMSDISLTFLMKTLSLDVKYFRACVNKMFEDESWEIRLVLYVFVCRELHSLTLCLPIGFRHLIMRSVYSQRWTQPFKQSGWECSPISAHFSAILLAAFGIKRYFLVCKWGTQSRCQIY
jgi:hypothetical protein